MTDHEERLSRNLESAHREVKHLQTQLAQVRSHNASLKRLAEESQATYDALVLAGHATELVCVHENPANRCFKCLVNAVRRSRAVEKEEER